MTVNWDYGARWHTSHHKRHNVEGWKHLNNVTTTWGKRLIKGFSGGGGGDNALAFTRLVVTRFSEEAVMQIVSR